MNSLLSPQRWLDIWNSQAWKPWARRFIILGVLGVSLLTAKLATGSRITQVLILVVGLIGVVILLQLPALGLFGILIGGFFILYTGPGGLNVSILSVAGITALWIVDMVVRQRKLEFARNRINLPIILFIITSIISFSIGQLSWYPLARHAPIEAQTGGLAIFVLSAFAFIIVGNIIHDLRWLKAFTWLFIAIGALYILARLVPSVNQFIGHYYQSNAIAGSIFWVWLLVIPFSQALLNRELNPAWRAALALLFAAVFYVSVIQSYDWKSGFIPPLAGVAFVVALLLRRRVVWFIPLLIIGGVYAGGQAIASDQYSWITRLEAWKIVLQLSTISPIFGIGFANYYWYTRLVPILGWHVSFNSHGQYIDIFSQTGLFGLICFFWIFWEIGKLGWHLKDRVPEGFAKAYVYGALGGLAGTLVAGGFVDWILPFVYNIGMNGFRSSVLCWLFLGGLVAINQIVMKDNLPQKNVPLIGRQQ